METMHNKAHKNINT